LDRILAPDFVVTSSTAHTFMKDDAIGDIKDSRYVVDKMALDEVSVNVYGGTAVSFTSQQEKSRYEGKDTSGHYHFTDTWVKKDGKWLWLLTARVSINPHPAKKPKQNKGSARVAFSFPGSCFCQPGNHLPMIDQPGLLFKDRSMLHHNEVWNAHEIKSLR